jgi:hypothetical protein
MSERIGFTGTRNLHHGDVDRIYAIVQALPGDAIYITGGCVGVDATVARIAYGLGRQVLTVVPADRSRVDPDWEQYCNESWELGPTSTYRDRNTLIVETSNRLIAFPEYPEDHARSKRSGTWQTIRMARSAGKPVEIHILRP